MVRLFGEERGTYLWESFVDPKKEEEVFSHYTNIL